MPAPTRPTPDRDSREWWERVALGEFAVQECEGCGLRRFPSRAFCVRCRGEGRRWVAIRPVGTVESWVVSHRPFGQGEIVVTIRLDEVPDAVVHGSWEGTGEPEGGSRARAVFTAVDDTLTLVGWREDHGATGTLEDGPLATRSVSDVRSSGGAG